MKERFSVKRGPGTMEVFSSKVSVEELILCSPGLPQTLTALLNKGYQLGIEYGMKYKRRQE